MSYENFYPKRIYPCPCLSYILNQVVSTENVTGYNDITKGITELCSGSRSIVYSVRVQNKTNAMIVCNSHMTISAVSEAKYNCTSAVKNDLFFKATQKRFCVDCVRHFCENFCSLFSFVDL